MATKEGSQGPVSKRYVSELTAPREVIDELKHVSNVAYVTWIQDVAKAHSTAVGWDSPAYFNLGAVFVVRKHEIEYLAPVVEGERVRLTTWIENWSAATSERHTLIEKVDSGSVAVKAKTLWAMIDFATGRPRRVPQEIKSAFLEGLDR
ncbi:MAG: acyl-CoA thioesterase [Polyangiaceae bacterium]|nr:acyl-CoA thioesterase [Polyangiaceae bacterium]